MLRLALATLRGRVVGFVASFIVLLFAAALVTACGILMETGVRGDGEPDRYAVAPVIVAGADSVLPPGGGEIDAVALPERARVGDAVVDEVGGLPGVTRVEWVDPGLALGVYGDGDPGRLRDRVAEVLPPDTLRAYAGDDRAIAEFPEREQARNMLLALSGSGGGTALLIAVFVVASTFGLLIQQRDREVALLRAIGATPKQVRAMILREIQVVAAVAGVLGVAPGVALAFWLRGALAERGFIPPGFSLTVGPVPMVAAVLIGIGVAWLASWSAARRATRIRPVEALGEAAVERRELGRGRVIAGILVAALSLLPLTMLGQGGQVAAAAPAASSLLLIVAAALFGPLIVRGAYRLTGWFPGRISPTSGYLAAAATRTSTRRRASAVAPLMLMVSFAGTSILVETTQSHAADVEATDGMLAEHVLVPEGDAVGLPPETAERARALPGDPAVTEVVHTQVLTEESLDVADGAAAMGEMLGEEVPGGEAAVMMMPAPAQGVTVEGVERNLDLDVRSGTLGDLEGNTVALSELTADAAGVAVGDELDLRMGDGAEVRLRVVAVYGRGLGFGAVTLPFELARAHTTERTTDQVLVSGADAAAVAELAAASPRVGAADREDALAGQRQARDLNAWVNYALLGVIAAFVAIAVVNTLVMATGERVREFALLRLVGTTRRQLLGMLRWEALFVGGLALVVGGVGVLIALVPFSLVMAGTPVPYVPPSVGVGLVAVTLLIALAAMVVPARVALRTPPAEALTKPM